MCTVRWLNLDVPADSPDAAAQAVATEDVSVYEVVTHPQFHYRCVCVCVCVCVCGAVRCGAVRCGAVRCGVSCAVVRGVGQGVACG
jgi:hypothetical protein